MAQVSPWTLPGLDGACFSGFSQPPRLASNTKVSFLVIWGLSLPSKCELDWVFSTTLSPHLAAQTPGEVVRDVHCTNQGAPLHTVAQVPGALWLTTSTLYTSDGQRDR